MVRTQIQLTERQSEALKRLAAQQNVSISELVRRGIETVISGVPTANDDELWERASSVVGAFRSGKTDIARRHDDYLAEDFAS